MSLYVNLFIRIGFPLGSRKRRHGAASHSHALMFSLCSVTDPGCARSYSMQTSGSFRKINPTLATLVTSLEQIVDTLQRAPPEWWKEGGDAILNEHHHYAREEEDEDDDESIDLQNLNNNNDESEGGEDEEDDESFGANASMDSQA